MGLKAPFTLDDRRIIQRALTLDRQQPVLGPGSDLVLFGFYFDLDYRAFFSGNSNVDLILVAVINRPCFAKGRRKVTLLSQQLADLFFVLPEQLAGKYLTGF